MGRTPGKMMDIGMMTKGVKLISAFFRPSSQEAWDEELQRTAHSLENLTSSTEDDFLSLGARLHQFNGKSREISQLASSITTLMSGNEMTDAMEGLRLILKRIQDLDKGSRQGTEMLRVILERIEALQRPLVGFARIIRNLRVLCNFIKIESARLECSDAGFNTLSEDVAKLTEKIAARSADLCNQSTLLSVLVKGNLSKIDEFEQSRHGKALFIVDGAIHCLNSLTEKHDLSVATLKDVATRWDQITLSIGEVVSSLQFHDITRQRIEHVKDSLVEITDRSPKAGRHTGVAGSKETYAIVQKQGTPGPSGGITSAVRTCELQRAQLDHARHEVVSAIERIIVSLQDIARHVEQMCAETHSLVEVTDTTASGSSFISSLEESFTILTGSIAEYDRINEQLSATIDHAAQTIEAMSAFISDIEKIGIEIRMIGLNACIRAAQVGEKGAALGVLADSIHQLSADTSGHTDIISASLKMVIESAHALTDSVNRETGSGNDGQYHLEQEITRMMSPLRQVDEETMTLLKSITEKGSALSGDIASTFAGIQVQQQFDRGIEDVVSKLDTFIARMKSHLPKGEDRNPQEDLGMLEDRYTMHSEREVHQAILAGGLGAAPAGIPAAEAKGEPSGSGPEDLGDNVELF